MEIKREVIIIIILLLIVLVLLAMDIVNISDKRTECLRSPLKYGVQQWEKANDDKIYCSCYFMNDKSNLLFVNSSTTKVDRK